VQDTLERALAKWALLRPGSRIESWLMTIMHNVFVNQLRQQAARPQQLALDGAHFDPPTPPRQEEGLALRDLQAALERLPPEQRAVLLLVTLEELSYEETARVLGVPVGTVMSRLSRARDRLRRLLAGEDAGVRQLRIIN
jgi:RNA polymerase sigma-70 factor (ECF subfamily)